jgi:folate-binding protein YgfZ
MKEFSKIPAGILSEWHYVRIKNNIPYPYNDLDKEKSFIIENNFEKINAIDFNKGCYIGQENTARQKYRGTAKRQLVVGRIVGKEIFNGEKVLYNKKVVGTVRSSSKELCLVNIRSEIYEKCKKNKTSIKIKESELTFI